MNKLLGLVLAAFLTGCGMENPYSADSVYLQHPTTKQIVECEGSIAMTITLGMGAGQLPVAGCVSRWQERGYLVGDHDSLKQQVKANPSLKGDK